MNTSSTFNEGVNALNGIQIALSPTGDVWLDGYVLMFVTSDGEICVSSKPDSGDKYASEMRMAMAQFKDINWRKKAYPTTPSVEMLVSNFFSSLKLKAYAMWAVSSAGACASTYAVYSSLTNEETMRLCDTMENCKDSYTQHSSITR